MSDEELALAAATVRAEYARKLVGWRLTAAMDALDKDKEVTAAGVVEARRLLDGNSQNIYLRLRLLSSRLVAASILLLVVLLNLGLIAWVADPGDGGLRVLYDGTVYWSTLMLGALGALLSFAIGTLRTGVNSRIYELASGNYATTAARVMTGSAAAVVAVVAVEARVLSAPLEWAPAIAVAAGFSERLVRRIVESLSASVERPVVADRNGKAGG